VPDVFADLRCSDAGEAPQLLSGRKRRVVIGLARDVLDGARDGWLTVDPILLLVCREFEDCSRADWAVRIADFHAGAGVAAQIQARSMAGVHPAWEAAAEVADEPEELDLGEILRRQYRPHEIEIFMEPHSGPQEWTFAPGEIFWRWRTVWRRLVRLTISNLTGDAWGTGGEKWDIKRVNLDEIARDERLRWRPSPEFATHPPGPCTYHCRMDIFRRART